MTTRRWLLLHGTPLTPAVWDGVTPMLAEHAPVLAPRLASPTGPSGAQVALEVALAAPERVASLTVVCSRATPFPAFAATAASLRAGAPVDPEPALGRWFRPDELAAGGPVVAAALRTAAARAG